MIEDPHPTWVSDIDRIIHRSGRIEPIIRYYRKRPRQGRWPKQRRRSMHSGIRQRRIAWDAHFRLWLYAVGDTTGTIGGRSRA